MRGLRVGRPTSMLEAVAGLDYFKAHSSSEAYLYVHLSVRSTSGSMYCAQRSDSIVAHAQQGEGVNGVSYRRPYRKRQPRGVIQRIMEGLVWWPPATAQCESDDSSSPSRLQLFGNSFVTVVRIQVYVLRAAVAMQVWSRSTDSLPCSRTRPRTIMWAVLPRRLGIRGLRTIPAKKALGSF
jgi:hypothetical protein